MGKITVADYLIKQLENLGITDVFGLPGDFNFDIVESVLKNKNMSWIGCTNELNAGYASDGYARQKGYGALVTTYGVGELSAINAVAGSFAEYVPVVKIVGIPSSENIEKNSIIHHNFANPDYKAFMRAYSNVVCEVAYLTKENAKEEIDKALSALINEKKPVYIAIPVDVANFETDDCPNIQIAKSNEKNLSNAIRHISDCLKTAKKPAVLADILVERFCAKDEFKKFLKKSNYPASTLLMGKSLINFEYENYLGTYVGKHDNSLAYRYINDSDCVITIGAIISDLNTFGFDLSFNPSDMIDIEPNYTIVENIKYQDVLMKDVLSALEKIVLPSDVKIPYRALSVGKCEIKETKKLDADFVYCAIQDFLKEDDIIICETGLVNFGFAPLEIPAGANVQNQVLWGSIGWATPAAFGSCRAQKDKRVILITGEGSHQLTAQEVSSMMRYGAKPIIIVVNNSGYTIERMLCKNSDDIFNDISCWDYSKLPEVFKGEALTLKAHTNEEFISALNLAQKEQENKLCYIEIFCDEMDVPKIAKGMFASKFSAKMA